MFFGKLVGNIKLAGEDHMETIGVLMSLGRGVVKYWAQKETFISIRSHCKPIWVQCLAFFAPPLIPPSDHKYPNGSHMGLLPQLLCFSPPTYKKTGPICKIGSLFPFFLILSVLGP